MLTFLGRKTDKQCSDNLFWLQSPRVFPHRGRSTEWKYVGGDREWDLRLIQFTEKKKKKTLPTTPSLLSTFKSTAFDQIHTVSWDCARRSLLWRPLTADLKAALLCPLYCARHATVHTFKGRARNRTVCIHHKSTKAKLGSSGCSKFVIFPPSLKKETKKKNNPHISSTSQKNLPLPKNFCQEAWLDK